MNKQELRKYLKKTRRDIPITERQKAAKQAAELLASSMIFQKSEHIAGYLAQSDEFDCMPIIEKIQQANKQLYLPVLTNANMLEFVAFKAGDPLQPNRYGILEPISENKISAAGLDLVILPLIGFDPLFNRLGTGGGYYDRTFSFLLSSLITRPLLIGLAYECQKLDYLLRDSWDVPLAGILTEEHLIFDHLVEKRNQQKTKHGHD